MTRAYIRLDPAFDERKHAYPDGAYAALIGTFCLAEHQPERGRFRSMLFLSRLLGSRGRWVKYLLEMGDLVVVDGDRVYVDGWDEWQEGDHLVKDRVNLIRGRRGVPTVGRSSGAERTAHWRLRTKIFERDNYTCRYCGNANYERAWLVLEHVVPDGPTEEGNLVTACRPCNKRKGGRTPEQAGMSLRPERDASRDASPDKPVTRNTVLNELSGDYSGGADGYALLEELTGRTAGQAGERQITEYDRHFTDYPPARVEAAYRKAAKAFDGPPTARQLVWAVRNILEPFVKPDDIRKLEERERADAEREASQRRVEATRRRAEELRRAAGE